MANLSNISRITIYDRSWGMPVQGNVLFGPRRHTLFDQVEKMQIPIICVEIKRQNRAEPRKCVILHLDFTSKKIQALYQKIVLLKKIDTWANTVILSFAFYPLISFVAAAILTALGASVLATKAVLITGGVLALAVPLSCGAVMLAVSLIGNKILDKLLIELNADIKKAPSNEEALRPIDARYAFLARHHVKFLKPYFINACRRNDMISARQHLQFFQAQNIMPDLSEEERTIVARAFTFDRRRHALALGLAAF